MTPAPKVLGVNLTTNPPHNSRIEINVGVLSVLFSYGTVIGYDYLDGVRVLEELNRHQQKHANQWRLYTKQVKVSEHELHTGILTALSQESEQLHFKLLEKFNA